MRLDGLKDAPVFGRAWWRAQAIQMVKATKALTKRGEGVDGAFPAYSDAYRKRKTDGKAGKLTQGGTGYRQASRSGSPDLMLTGDFMRDLKNTAAHDNGCSIGWPAQGAKVEWNAASGRAVSTDDDVLAPSTMDAFDRAFNAELDKRLLASAGTVHIKI